jgi:hypothetical protein
MFVFSSRAQKIINKKSLIPSLASQNFPAKSSHIFFLFTCQTKSKELPVYTMYGANIPLQQDPLKHGHVRKDPLQTVCFYYITPFDGPDSISSREATLPTRIWWRLMKGKQRGFSAVF